MLLLAACRNERDFLAKGDELAGEKRFAEAELQYRRALQKAPDSAVAQLKIAQSLRAQNNPREALGFYLSARNSDPSNAAVQKEAADLMLSIFLASPSRPKALYDELQKTSQLLTRQDPSSVDALRIAGTLALAEGRFEDAEGLLRQVLTKRPGHEQATLALVEALYFSKKLQEAESLASGLLKANPQSSGAYRRLYGIYLDQGRKGDAVRVLESQAKAMPTDSSPVIALARHYIAVDKNGDLGLSQLQQLSSNPRQYPDGLLAAGLFLFEAGDIPKATSILEEGLSKFPFLEIEVRKLLAECYIKLNRRERAVEQLEAAARKDPKNESILVARAIAGLDETKRDSVTSSLAELDELKKKGVKDSRVDYQRGRAFFLLGKESEGLQAFRDAIRTNRNNLDARFAIVAHALGRGRPSEALQELDQVERVSPEHPRAILYRIQALRFSHRTEEAANLLRQAISMFPERQEFLLERGVFMLESRRFNEALQSFRELFDKNIRTTQVIAGLVQSYMELKQAAAARAVLDKELAANPTSMDLQALRADLYAQQGELNMAIASFEKLNKPHAPNTAILSNLSQLYMRAGDFEKAFSAFEKMAITSRNPSAAYGAWVAASISARNAGQVAKACEGWILKEKSNWVALNNCAYGLAQTNSNLEMAENYARQALNMQAQQPNLKDTLGFVLIQRQKFVEAAAIYSQLCAQQPKNPTFHFHFGLTQAGSGNKIQAKISYEQALRSDPNPALERAIRKAMEVL